MNINDAYPSKYLKASDLPDEGAEAYTIEGTEIEEIGRDREKKPVIHFEETDKGLVCNKTNARSIARLLGSDDFDDWIGHKIYLYRAEVEFQGDMVEAIRVKSKTPPKAAKTPSGKKLAEPAPDTGVDEENDEVPF
jgi:hypothetical protein